MMIKYLTTIEFQKDLKRMLKKFKSLEFDIDNAKESTIELFHIRKLDNNSIFQIQGFNTEKIKIYKIKKFACKALKGCGIKSGIRVIYAFHWAELKVIFLQIYYKGDQEKEDYERIKTYLKNESRA